MKTFDIRIAIETNNEQIDWDNIEEYVKQKLEEGKDLKVADINAREREV